MRALEELLLMNLMWVLKELSFLWLWFIYCDYQPWMQIIIVGEHDESSPVLHSKYSEIKSLRAEGLESIIFLRFR